MFSINTISVILMPFCIPFKYVFNCDLGKMSNFVKWLGLSRSLATPDVYKWNHKDIFKQLEGIICRNNHRLSKKARSAIVHCLKIHTNKLGSLEFENFYCVRERFFFIKQHKHSLLCLCLNCIVNGHLDIVSVLVYLKFLTISMT